MTAKREINIYLIHIKPLNEQDHPARCPHCSSYNVEMSPHPPEAVTTFRCLGGCGKTFPARQIGVVYEIELDLK
jgi:hypothetical protein